MEHNISQSSLKESSEHVDHAPGSTRITLEITLSPGASEITTPQDFYRTAAFLAASAGGSIEMDVTTLAEATNRRKREEILNEFADELRAHFTVLKDELQPRPLETLGHLLQGGTNAEIGEKMGIAPQTVKNHLKKIQNAVGGVRRDEWCLNAVYGREVLVLADNLGFGLEDKEEFTNDEL